MAGCLGAPLPLPRQEVRRCTRGGGWPGGDHCRGKLARRARSGLEVGPARDPRASLPRSLARRRLQSVITRRESALSVGVDSPGEGGRGDAPSPLLRPSRHSECWWDGSVFSQVVETGCGSHREHAHPCRSDEVLIPLNPGGSAPPAHCAMPRVATHRCCPAPYSTWALTCLPYGTL